VEVDGVLAGDHLVLPRAAGALLLLRHPSLSLLLLRLLAAAAAAGKAGRKEGRKEPSTRI
jgi:hypothetical protein